MTTTKDIILSIFCIITPLDTLGGEIGIIKILASIGR
jgi:hypothetical protein